MKIKMHVLPDLPETEFAAQLRQAQVFFAHSYPEGFGLPMLEAMSCGVIPIGYTGGGAEEFAKSGINCWIAPDGDAAAVGRFLQRVLTSSTEELKLMRRLGVATGLAYSKNNARDALFTALSQLTSPVL
jgi:glycosyltransferase involved in cell wall biosynthesis